MAIARATDIFMCVLLYNVLLLSSSLEAYAQLRSCSPGTFCPIGANCTSNTNLCVDFCPTKNDLMQQGNHLTGNCERVPDGTDHWMDSTSYEVFILSNQPVNTPILNISFLSTDQFQTNNFTYQGLPSDITFTLVGSCPYFYFTNLLKEVVSFENYYDLYVHDDIQGVSLAVAEPVPPDDYEMEVTVTNGGTVLERRNITVHVRDVQPCTTGPDTFFVLATITDDRNQSFQELLSNGSIYLWPTRPIQGIVFECISTEDNPQIYLSSSNQISMRLQIGFSQFSTSLNGFLVCRSNTTGEERRIYIANATVAGGIAVPITQSPFMVMEGESAVFSYLIALVDKSLNVTSSVEVGHDYDGPLPDVVIIDRDNDRYDVIFPPISYGIEVTILLNETTISTEPLLLDLQYLDVANVILQPENQTIVGGQNAFFHCLLNDTNGRLIPVQWSYSIDGRSFDIATNNTQFLILPPANSGLVFIRPMIERSVICRGGTREYSANLSINRDSNDCSVDNGNCEEICTQSNCSCPNGQTLIRTSCVSQSTYFDIYNELYEDSDIFIHHPFYHPGRFEITCRSQIENAITERGQWIIQAFDNSTTIAFNGGTIILNNSSITASAVLSIREPFMVAILTIDQPIEGNFTCIVNNISNTVRILTGGRPLLELLTPEPIYITSSSRNSVAVRAFVVNSFGKTVRASQSHLAVTIVNGTDRSNNIIEFYDQQSGGLVSVLPKNVDIQTEFGSSGSKDIFVEISLTSAANFTATLSYSPVYAEITNITSIGGQTILVLGQLTLDCFTIPSDLPVVWVAIGFKIPDSELATDPRAIIQSTEYGSRLTLTNMTVRDSRGYGCSFNRGEAFADIFVTIIPDPVSIGYDISEFGFPIFPFIIPDGNVINYLNNIRVRRGEFQFFSRPLNCYSISGHENAVWQIPINSSFNSTLSVISPYRSVLHITSSSPEQAVETFVCRSSNNFSSSVIITNNDLYIQPLSPNPFIVKYFQPVALSFQVAALSNGISNIAVPQILLERSGSSEPLSIRSTANNSQVFTEELGFAGNRTTGNYTASVMFEIFFGNSTVEVIVEFPDLVATRTTINVLLGESVTVGCIPSDSSLELQWQVITRNGSELIPPDDEGSAEIMTDDDDGEGSVIPRSNLASRLRYQSLIHQLTLINTTMNDNGNFSCHIKPSSPNDNINIFRQITLNVLTNVISIGYSLDMLIPENNAINLRRIPIREGSRRSGFMSCFTTQGHENPVWMISSNSFSSGPLMNNGTVMMVLGGVNVTVTIDRISLYESSILIDATGANFTSNLTCQSQNNTSVQYTVIITTREFYLQSLSPNPTVVGYLQPVSLAFLVARNSDGISNSIKTLQAFRVNNFFTVLSTNRLETSTQIFTIDLDEATEVTTGNYTISSFEVPGVSITVEVIVELPTVTTGSSSIGILSGENVTFECLPSDPDIELYWRYQTNGNRGNITIDSISETRFLSELPLLHQLILPNATINDGGIYECVAQEPFSSIASETIVLDVLPDIINIGYSSDALIPENNVINLNRNIINNRNLSEPRSIFCFTTRGHENPFWMVSNDDFSSGPLMNTGEIRMTALGGGNIITETIRHSLYWSEIYIDADSVNFTANLTCQSNNSEVQHTVIVTTSEYYVQPLTPIPIVIRYFQPINLTFLVAASSDGISNDVNPDAVFQYNPPGTPVGPPHPLRTSEDSSQILILDLDRAGLNTTGHYLIFNPYDQSRNTTIGIIMVEVPNITAVQFNKDFLSGETVTFECIPSYPDVELYWTYETSSGSGNITIDSISQSRFLSGSSLLHQLILPIANVSDTGNYSCVVPGPPGDSIISQTIPLTVLPACGSLDRLSHGVLWPITKVDETAEMFCSDLNPSFGFGPYATRRCRDDTTWSRVDTSQCSIRPMQQSTIVVSSIYVEVDNIDATNITSPEIMQLNRTLYDNFSMISTELTVLSDRLYVPAITDTIIDSRIPEKRQVSSMQYSLLAPVIFTANIMNRTTSAENVTQMIRSADIVSADSEIIGFNSVDICECISSSGDLEQSSVIDICIGVSGSPCICDNVDCRCNEEGYTGNGSLCARDTDRDTFPDVNLTCSLPTCLADKCPLIATMDGQDESSCQPLSNTTVHCPQDDDAEYGVRWPPTIANMDATNNCPDGSGRAVRSCDSNGQWGTPVVANCSSYAYRVLMTLMEEVENGTAELSHLISSLASVSNRTDEAISAYPADLMNTNSLLNFSLNNIEQNPEILASDELVQDIADCFSNILSFDNNAGWMELEATNPGQSQMLLMNSERFSLLLAENLEIGSNRMVVSDNIVIVAELVDANNISDVFFSAPNSSFSINNSIFIPASYIQQRSMITNINPVPIVNIIYENIENILPSVNIQPVSQVLSSQVTNTSNTSSDNAIELTLQYSLNNNDSTPVCGFWNFTLNEGRGGWDTEGVSVVDIVNSSTITCNSTHLTSFAVLVDVSGGHEDFSDEERTALSVVSYVGCGISIVCLVIAIIVLVYFRNTLLKGIHNFIHLNLAIALLLALIVFVSGIETATDSEVACKIVAALLHYFFTAVFTWMLCEGIMLYFLLVKVFNTGPGQRKLFYLALGWGIPVPIVAISAGIAHDQYGHDDFCWIDYDEGAIWGFVAPMLAIIIANVVFLLLALRSLYKSKRGKMTGEEASKATIVKTVLKATVILLPLLGLTWVFGILAVNQESSVFAWIFTILNSLQGMFILFLHVIRNEKIWQKISSYWKDDKYSFIPSSQRSSTASRGARIKKSIQTTSTTDPSNSTEMKSKLDTSTFQESSGMDTESKSLGIEASVVETENEKPPITTDADIRQEEEAVTTTTFSMDVTVPSSNETDL